MQAVLITGAATRIGRGVCEHLAREGWHVLVHYRTSRAAAEAAVETITRAGGVADALEADLADLDQAIGLVDRAAAVARERGSRLVALVNNASVFEYDTLHTMNSADWARHIHVNLRAPLFMTQRFAAVVAGGCVVHILDNKVAAPNPDYFTYTVAKLGLAASIEASALALAPAVRVCGVAPGITLISGDQTAEEFASAHRANPLGRGCTVEQIAATIRFIFDTPSMTGQIIVVDGGQSLAKPSRDVAFLTAEPDPERIVHPNAAAPDRDDAIRHHNVFLTDHSVLASIGIHPGERKARQRLLISVRLLLDPDHRVRGDAIDTVVDYDFLRVGIAALVAERHYDLQETLVGDILALCSGRQGIIGAVVSTRKPDIYPDCTAVGYEAEATFRTVKG